MKNKYHCKDEYLLDPDNTRHNEKKCGYTFLVNLLKVTIPSFTIIGTILLICFFI
jgi:hypothetical protein